MICFHIGLFLVWWGISSILLDFRVVNVNFKRYRGVLLALEMWLISLLFFWGIYMLFHSSSWIINLYS